MTKLDQHGRPEPPVNSDETAIILGFLEFRRGGDRPGTTDRRCLAVDVTAGVVAGQCLQLDLLDELAIDLVPVVMGGGRHFFGNVAVEDVPLGNPTTCIQGDRVTHLTFPVIR